MVADGSLVAQGHQTHISMVHLNFPWTYRLVVTAPDITSTFKAERRGKGCFSPVTSINF